MLKKIFFNQQTPFWFIAFSILVGLTLPTLIKDAMFMDAMVYSSVSHNLSMGIGTFWFPQFSIHNIAGLSSFHEQPPLVFGIQSLFFKLLGDSMYVERIYTFITMCITALLIHLLWKRIFNDNSALKKLSWLPIILWITIPVCFWSYSNNMQENTLGIFTLCSVLFSYKAFRAEKYQILLWIISGVFIFLASFSKGLPGFFPLLAPFLYWLTTRKISFIKMSLQTFVIALVPILIYAILFIIPESKESLSIYLFERALHRINEVPTVSSRFYILLRILMELIPQIILVVILIFISRISKIKYVLSEHARTAVFLISVGLSASLPLMLTLVQKGFYFVPSLPFFAIGLSILIAPVVSKLTERIKIQNKKYIIFLFISIFLFIGATTIAFMQKGKISRNKELVHDVYLIGASVPKQITITIPIEMWDNWSLQACLMRYFNISLETDHLNSYYINDKEKKINVPQGYNKVNIKTLQYDLYKIP